jgi:hypothetical protein
VRAGGGPVPYSEVWEEFCEYQRAQAAGKFQPVPFFDLPRLNTMTGGGMYEQQLITVGQTCARKKSCLKQTMDYNSAQGVGCIYFSREMEDGPSSAAPSPRDRRRRRLARPASLVRNAYSLDEYRKGEVCARGRRSRAAPSGSRPLTSNVGELYQQVRFWLARTYPEWLRRNHPERWEEMRSVSSSSSITSASWRARKVATARRPRRWATCGGP